MSISYEEMCMIIGAKEIEIYKLTSTIRRLQSDLDKATEEINNRSNGRGGSRPELVRIFEQVRASERNVSEISNSESKTEEMGIVEGNST